jgi:CRISPR-associated protein Cst2
MASLTLSCALHLEAHSLSNVGSNGSNRLLSRRVKLADGTETDAWSGNILKHHHAALCAEYMAAEGGPLCPACAVGDGRRAMALISQADYKNLTIDRILLQCGVCDVHGFLVTPKGTASAGSTETRQRISKHSVIEFGFGLARPDRQAETTQLFTRAGNSKADGQMLMKMPTRSGMYAMNVRYKSMAIGVDTDTWRVVVPDEDERRRRHRAVLAALRDQVLSPIGALTSTMLPHLAGIEGVIALQAGVGLAPIYSALNPSFIDQLVAMATDDCQMLVFQSAAEFAALMNQLIESSYPYLPAPRRLLREDG